MYLFRSFRKPKLEHHYKIIDETIELRKLMGWTGHGGITNGMLNPSGMVSHYRRFDSLSEIDNHLSTAQSNPKVGEKITQMNKMCERYANMIFEVIRPVDGISDLSEYKFMVQWWFKVKPGHLGNVVDILSDFQVEIGGVKPFIQMPLSTPDLGDITMGTPIKSLSVIRSFSESRKATSSMIDSLKEHIIGTKRMLSGHRTD
tara:strand:+ start:247 stop:852 length:606 start_codon:yes stop_codon:yes gene_type:complete